MKTVTDFKPGDAVRYVPYHANGEINHEDCVNGVVTSTNQRYVFVQFGGTGYGLACKPDQLVKV